MNAQENGESEDKGYLIKSSLTFSVVNIVLFIVGIFSIWVSGNFISAYDMGIISIFSVFYSMAELMTLSLNVGIQRYLSMHIGEQNDEKAQSIVNLAFILLLFYLLGTNIFIPIIMIFAIGFLSIPIDFIVIMIVIAACNCYQLFYYFNNLLSVYKHYNKVAIISFIASLSGTLASLFLIIQGFSVSGFMIRFVVSNLVGFVILFVILVKLKLSFRKKSNAYYDFKKILNFSLPHFLNVLFVTMIFYFFLKLTIAGVLGLEILGYYEFSFTIINLFSSVMLGFNNIILIHLSHEYGKRGIDGIEDNLNWVTRFSTFLIIPILYLTLIFGYSALLYFLPRYLPSVVFLNTLVISGVMPLIYYSFTAFLFAYGKNWEILVANGVSISSLFIVYIFLPYLGITGIIIGDYIVRLLYLGIIFAFCAKYIEIKRFVIIPVTFVLKTIPILIIGLLLGFFFPQIYFIPVNLLIFMSLTIIWVRYGKLISAWEIDKGFSFLPPKIIKLVKKILIK